MRILTNMTKKLNKIKAIEYINNNKNAITIDSFRRFRILEDGIDIIINRKQKKISIKKLNNIMEKIY